MTAMDGGVPPSRNADFTGAKICQANKATLLSPLLRQQGWLPQGNLSDQVPPETDPFLNE
ncbi:hypothetical protein [Microbulbifer magnicolonia]|uniref:hypothetical protein n=1 Tax=Microbulbifer magnicolonia TaxID=3109744 RepID=UPI002B417C72|nr:hypothetical protein [Microbulbifer sp. GG15]